MKVICVSGGEWVSWSREFYKVDKSSFIHGKGEILQIPKDQTQARMQYLFMPVWLEVVGFDIDPVAEIY